MIVLSSLARRSKVLRGTPMYLAELSALSAAGGIAGSTILNVECVADGRARARLTFTQR
ncbi:hypothetical protein RISK_002340 [Rhodopirellula islandica]|uniref:Uncharacterized protein n=1 Tax=Rhodopirellula islandica TaxID=595434 RepID=A0A0J1BGN9_RHOIS|nr:hypothetical protein RISK_002340 [Rhodopirellula islandica]